MQEQDQIRDPSTLFAFAGAVVIGGSNFVAVKFSNEELEPLFGSGVRFAVGAILLLALARIQRKELPRGRAAAGAAVYGLLGFAVSYALLYYALLGLAAGTLAVFIAATPLVTLILAVLYGQERFTPRGLVGGALAIAGITVISLDTLGGDLRPIYLMAALAAVVAVSGSVVVVKGFPRSDPITTNALGMSVGAGALLIASLALREQWMLPQEPKTWFVLGWLSIAGSVGLFVLFLFVIKRWTASATGYALTLMPVVAIALGALLADEEITTQLLVGGALVMTAVYVGALSDTAVPARPVEVSTRATR